MTTLAPKPADFKDRGKWHRRISKIEEVAPAEKVDESGTSDSGYAFTLKTVINLPPVRATFYPPSDYLITVL